MAEHDLTYVLISDDHELHAALENSFFQRAGFVIRNISSKDDAMTMISTLRPVMVILTLAANGDRVCHAVKQDSELRSTPVALVANYEDEIDRERCHEAGCDEILRRPLSSKQILAASYRMLKVVVDRFEFRGVVQVRGRCGSDNESLRECTILNLSAGGAFIETGKLRPVDSEVLLEFNLPDTSQPVTCSGRVAWLNHPEWSRKPQLPIGYGVQFGDMEPPVRSRIEDYIHSKN